MSRTTGHRPPPTRKRPTAPVIDLALADRRRRERIEALGDQQASTEAYQWARQRQKPAKKTNPDPRPLGHRGSKGAGLDSAVRSLRPVPVAVTVPASPEAGRFGRLTVPVGTYLEHFGRHRVTATVQRYVFAPATVKTCGMPLDSVVPIGVTSRGVGRVYRLQQCKNRIGGCPYCSGWWRQELAGQLEAATRVWLGAGGAASMVVLTVSHHAAASLAGVYDLVMASWQRFRVHRAPRELLGPIWYRALDLVVGGFNGPHPHLNVLWHHGQRLTGNQRERLSRTWARCVQSAAVALGVTAAQEDHLRAYGLRVIDVDDGNVGHVSPYVARALEGLGTEVVSGIKQTKGYTPTELACLADAGHEDAGRYLAHVMAVMAGKRAGQASGWWRRLYGELDEDEDADMAAGAGFVFGELRASAMIRQREQVQAWLDWTRRKLRTVEESVAELRRLDQAVNLGIDWLAEPVAASEYLAAQRARLLAARQGRGPPGVTRRAKKRSGASNAEGV